MAKIYLADLPDFIEQLCYKVRQGLRKTRDDQILQVMEPATIRVSGEAIIRKDDLIRISSTSRSGPLVRVTVDDPSTTTEVRPENITTSEEAGSTSSVRHNVDNGIQTGAESSVEANNSSEVGASSGGDLSHETNNASEVGASSGGDSSTEHSSGTENSGSDGAQGGTESTESSDSETHSESGSDSGVESGASSGGQDGTQGQSGSNVETIIYECGPFCE